ncbi:HNH endonuclease [Paeniglutamicibacter sp. ABSL32-1]|uniref:HNH endonuclease signature motif containing protein n=1 Tax=Paeniglutamicibacter quisquiliarum TaxID=2849498 RepID=UPI001C2DD4FC|nr:HNH endonuclease [Paeniglutamicibacter quisquiliarum]MBV1779755.1 HNH endonuclease [Paeniglutamicibacter quisquiliarum]
MQTDALITALAGHGDSPGYSPTPDDEQRALFEIFRQADALVSRIAARTNSPTRALLAAMTVEHAQHALQVAQLKLARLSRQSLVHELPAQTLTAVRVVAEDPAAFVAGEARLPDDPRTVPTGRLQFRTPADCLAAMVGIDYFEARNRMQAADDLLPGLDEHGFPRGPRYPQLARQLAVGQSALAPMAAAARKLEKLRPGIEARPDAARFAEEAESRVAESVAAGVPKDTARLFNRISDALDDASDCPTPREIRNKTGIVVTKVTRHFTYFTACMLNIDAEVFLSHFAESDNARTLAGNRQAMAAAATVPGREAARTGPAAGVDADTAGGPEAERDPQSSPEPELLPAPADGPDWFDHPPGAETLEDPPPQGGSDPEIGASSEGPTPAQRHLQTLLNLMRASHPTPKGATGLPTSKLVVHINLETLLGIARGAGWTAHGLEISVTELRKRLAEFGVIPVVFGGDGQILDYGRERRYPPESMKLALSARDGGCIKPGCAVPPEHVEFHHIEPWSEGGTTSVWNLGMFCTADHRAADKGDLGVVMKNGVPWVLLPEFEDPAQIPRRNTHWPGQQPPLF